MTKFFSSILFITMATWSFSQSPVGKWKIISQVKEWQGEKFDWHKTLLSQRPCAANIIYVIHSDGTYRLDASQSGCDDSYKKMQEKLYAQSVWTVTGNVISIGNKKAPTVGQKYTFTITGNKMDWKGTDGQGIITYQKM